MIDYLKANHLSVLIILFLAVNSFFGAGDMKVGVSAVSEFTNPILFTKDVDIRGTGTDLQVGTSGTAASRLNFGTCYILAYATTIAASTSATVDCQGTALIYNTNTSLASALTGVTNSDVVAVQLSTTTAKQTFGSLDIVGASASSTSGYITLTVQNNSGGTFTWPLTGNATGTASYIILDN